MKINVASEPQFIIDSCSENRSRAQLVESAKRVSDWQQVVKLASTNGVAAYVQKSLNLIGSEVEVPSTTVAGLNAVVTIQAAQRLELTAVAEQIAKLTADAGIPVITLKGFAVSNLLYDNPSMRPSQDIDLLCKESDLSLLDSLLVENGFNSEDASASGHKGHSELETAFERHYRDKAHNVLVELHVDGIKLGVKPVHTIAIWERAIPVELGSETTLSLSYSDMVFMLSVHLHRHGFNRLIWFKDLDLLIRAAETDVDWDHVIKQAEDEGAAASVWLALRYLAALFDTPVPDVVMSSLRPGFISRLGWRVVWPVEKVLNLDVNTRRRVVQFSVEESWRGMLPSLVLMGRRRQKLRIMVSRALRR